VSFRRKVPQLMVVGSTGAGKSCLCNFLLNPSVEHINHNPTFKFSGGAKSCTSEIQIERSLDVAMIDTPGLNTFSSVCDFENMIKLVEKLHDVELSGILFVAKFGQRLDKQWASTVKYFQNLLGKTFIGRSTALVLTNYSTWTEVIKRRKQEKKDPEKIAKEAALQFKQHSSVKYLPKVFMIDSLPYPEDRAAQLATRDAILSYFPKKPTMNLQWLEVIKTKEILSADREMAAKLRGINVKPSGMSSELIKKVEQKFKELMKVHRQKQHRLRRYSDLDSDEEVIAARWPAKEEDLYEMRAGRRDYIKFHLEWDCPRTRIARKVDPSLEIRSIDKSGRAISGMFERKKSGIVATLRKWATGPQPLLAELTVHAQKRDFYNKELTKLKEEMAQDDDLIRRYNSQLKQVKEANHDKIKAIDELLTYLKREEEINELESDRMTIDKARARLKQEQLQTPDELPSTSKL